MTSLLIPFIVADPYEKKSELWVFLESGAKLDEK